MRASRIHTPIESSPLPRSWSEFLGVGLVAFGALLLGALGSYQFGDGLLMGPVGRLAASTMYAALGMASYLLGAAIAALGVKALIGSQLELDPLEGAGFAVATVAACVLLHLLFPLYRVHGYTAGGLGGELLAEVGIGMFGHAGTALLSTCTLLLGLFAATPLSAVHLLAVASWGVQALFALLGAAWGGAVALVQLHRQAAAARAAGGQAPPADAQDDAGQVASPLADDEPAELDEPFAPFRLVPEGESSAHVVAEPGLGARLWARLVGTRAARPAMAPSGPADQVEAEEPGEASGVPAASAPRLDVQPLMAGPIRKNRKLDERRSAAGAPPTAEPSDDGPAEDPGARLELGLGLAEPGASAPEPSRRPIRPRARGQGVDFIAPALGVTAPVIAEPEPEPVAPARPEIVEPAAPAEPAPARTVTASRAVAPASALGGKRKAPPRPEELARAAAAGPPELALDDPDEPAPPQDDDSDDDDAEPACDGAPATSPAPGSAHGAAPVPAPKPRRRPHQVIYLRDRYELPSLALFAHAEKAPVKVDREWVFAQAEQIERALGQFRIKGKVTTVHPGPVITRYELKPEAGVKVAKIQNLENDLAMALEAIRIRILAPIPGKATVGFEVPNKQRETVYIQEILGDEGFGAGGKAKLPLGLGKSITGKPQWLDLAKAPHLLVAGATGSGKSVGVNTMICSLLYSCSPEDVRLILIDPKMLEFSIYQDIPHLLLPVITDADKANQALKWAVAEMERRYALLSDARVRNLEGYNEKLPELQREWDQQAALHEAEAAELAQARADGEDARTLTQLGYADGAQGRLPFGQRELPPRPDKLPYIVVIIDEFADLMMVASKEVETSVARIAAKARAAGIHLIVATQRPSVDVITGTIKNNFPSRIAFQVTSDVDSRTILDQKGAKQLLGMGDMLYMDRGQEPQRVHGCYVSEHEIEKVVAFIKRQAKPSYDLDLNAALEGLEGSTDDETTVRQRDELYDKAVQFVAETQKVSTSAIQRKFGIGYNRAAKIVEAMEAEGVIGPARGTAPREVYVSAA